MSEKARKTWKERRWVALGIRSDLWTRRRSLPCRAAWSDEAEYMWFWLCTAEAFNGIIWGGLELQGRPVTCSFRHQSAHACIYQQTGAVCVCVYVCTYIYICIYIFNFTVWCLIYNFPRAIFFFTATGRIFCSSLGLLLTHCQSSASNHSQCFSDHIISNSIFPLGDMNAVYCRWKAGRRQAQSWGVFTSLFVLCLQTLPLNLQMLLTRDFDASLTSFLCRRAATWFVQKVF